MTTLLNIADWIFIFVLGLPVLYLFVFALFSTRKNMDDYPQAKRRRKFVTLIPAYKSDAVIVRTAQAALRQEYPAQLHEVVVIADRLKPETLAELRTLPIRVLEVSFENSSKAKALNFAVEELGPEAAEAVTILDADNLAGEDFIARLNDVFDSGVQAVQAHRTAKNRDTDTAVLDAASEEINNAIFRRGHVALGLSSALIGSGHGLRIQVVPRQHRPLHHVGRRQGTRSAAAQAGASTSTTSTACACWTRRCRAKAPTTTSGADGSPRSSTRWGRPSGSCRAQSPRATSTTATNSCNGACRRASC